MVGDAYKGWKWERIPLMERMSVTTLEARHGNERRE
jgi:hypothetical protein